MNRRKFIRALLTVPAIPLVLKGKEKKEFSEKYFPGEYRRAGNEEMAEQLRKALEVHEGIDLGVGILFPQNLDRDLFETNITKIRYSGFLNPVPKFIKIKVKVVVE